MIETDVLIVGTGAAGLYCALHLPSGLRVTVITKDDPENSDSFLAQGGISTLLDENDYDAYYEDTMRAGRYENNSASVRAMIGSSREIIDDLVRRGVNFDRDETGFNYTREGAHSAFRILHHDDLTGREITSRLLFQVRALENVTLLDHTVLLDLTEADGHVTGAVVRLADGTLDLIAARKVVLATGGIGGIFHHSTNFPHITGDAFAIALRHGIALQNLHYIQIHPTTLYSDKPGRAFLISESVRGEGAYLLNRAGERFCDELEPRDVVTAHILAQMKQDGTDHVWLSLRHLDPEKVHARFPNISKRCAEEGLDLARDLIPVVPAQHYLMGGIETDQAGRTSLPGLFAVGECGCNGVHGANRLASNSLLESLVFSRNAAREIAATIADTPAPVCRAVLAAYADQTALQQTYHQLIWSEIKRKDRDFYDKWRNHEDAD